MALFQKYKRLGGSIIILVTLMALFAPAEARAQVGWVGTLFGWLASPITSAASTALTNIGANVVSLGALAFNYILSYIAGGLLAFAAELVSIVVTLNGGVLGSENVAVHLGWQIIRDVANLGFVLLMVIMAVATILRVEGYAFKRLFPKFVAAAILINFSFALAGVFIDFTQTLTTFFFNKIGNVEDIGSSLAGAFSVQRFGLAASEATITNDAITVFGTAALTQILGLTFTIIFTVLAVVTLLGYGVMLIFRYLWLSFLVIVAPIVWLFWVFPPLSHHFSKWWSKFIQWSFFAPASAFFIYLAFQTIAALKDSPAVLPKGVFFASAMLQGVATQGAQMVLVVGLMLGGLIMAQSMGIKGASSAIGIAKLAGKKTGSLVAGGASRLGSRLLQGKGRGQEKTYAERIEDAAQRQRGVARFALGWIARGARGITTAGGEGVVKDHDKAVEKFEKPNLKAALLTATGPRKIAILKRLAKEGMLTDIDIKQHLDEKTKQLFERFGQGKSFGDVEKSSVLNASMIEALNAGDMDTFSAKLDELIGKYTKDDVNKSSIRDWFSDKSKFGFDTSQMDAVAKRIAGALVRKNHVLVPNMLTKMNSEVRERFINIYEEALNEYEAHIATFPSGTDKTREEERFKRVRKAFDDTLNAAASSIYEGTPPSSPGGAPPSPPPPKTP